MIAALYANVARLGEPLIRLYLQRRVRRGREDASRIGERFGIASRTRPDGALVWLHAASIGEAFSVLRLIERITASPARPHVLVTTGTVTSARLLAGRLPERAFHQFVPVDHPDWVRRFLGHWRPDLAILVESEFWPTMMIETHKRGIPMALVNARISARSYRGWQRFPSLIRPLVESFAIALAQDQDSAERLTALGARKVVMAGNLKFAAGPLACDPNELWVMGRLLGERPRWLAASTHEGEEAVIARAHMLLRERFAGIVTMIAPRHPHRGEAITRDLEQQGLVVSRRSAGDPIGPETDIYLADTLGELGLLFRLASVVFVGGSLVPHGGQNPLEPARLGAAVLFGPHMENFTAVAAELLAAGAAFRASDESGIEERVAHLLDDRDARDAAASAGFAIATGKEGILDAVLSHLEPLLAALPAPATSPATSEMRP
ncbi:MAG: 3-deoxy-D-manno-octulosonic acid transferase [Gemmatimonas sp.]